MISMDTPLELPNIPKNMTDKIGLLKMVEFDIEVNAMLKIAPAYEKFQVDGAGRTVAVFDTGLRADHECFAGRVLPGLNLSNEGGPGDTEDIVGHGTNVAGLIAARGVRPLDPRAGIAPGARILPVKVFPGGDVSTLLAGLQWVREHYREFDISVVNMSLGAPSNFATDMGLEADSPGVAQMQAVLRALAEVRVAVVLSAGNHYFEFKKEGMAFPAILRECISVGAVYDANVGRQEYEDGAIALQSRANQVTPFSQRLSSIVNPLCCTTIFAPGAVSTSTGHKAPNDTSAQNGTSQAAPTVAGVVLLIQQFVLRQSGELPSVQFIKDCLVGGAEHIVDNVAAVDNVPHTGMEFPRLNALMALEAAQSRLTLRALLLA